MTKEFTRVCPHCGHVCHYETKQGRDAAITRGKRCRSCAVDRGKEGRVKGSGWQPTTQRRHYPDGETDEQIKARLSAKLTEILARQEEERMNDPVVWRRRVENNADVTRTYQQTRRKELRQSRIDQRGTT